jgi:dephospho-CoA kinase
VKLKKKILCVTGGAAAGKSSLCRLIAQKTGAFYIDADKEVRHLYDEDESLRNNLVRLLGGEILFNDRLSRMVIARKIFYDEGLRLSLEGLVYPKLYERIMNKIHNIDENYDLVIIEAVKPVESGLKDAADRTVAVLVDRWTQLDRLESKGLPYSFCWALLNSQYHSYFYADISDCVVYNTGSLEDLSFKADYLIEKISSEL